MGSEMCIRDRTVSRLVITAVVGWILRLVGNMLGLVSCVLRDGRACGF